MADKTQCNSKKCEVMHIGNQNPQYDNNVISDNHPVMLKSTECEKDLGVHIDNKAEFQITYQSGI